MTNRNNQIPPIQDYNSKNSSNECEYDRIYEYAVRAPVDIHIPGSAPAPGSVHAPTAPIPTSPVPKNVHVPKGAQIPDETNSDTAEDYYDRNYLNYLRSHFYLYYPYNPNYHYSAYY